MQLEEFISQVLGQVVSGIRLAQPGEGGAFIVPSGDGGHVYASHERMSSSARLKSTIVDFDIALTIEEAHKKTGEDEVRVAGIGENLIGESLLKDTRVSRVRFSVPVLLPECQRDWHSELKRNASNESNS